MDPDVLDLHRSEIELAGAPGVFVAAAGAEIAQEAGAAGNPTDAPATAIGALRHVHAGGAALGFGVGEDDVVKRHVHIRADEKAAAKTRTAAARNVSPAAITTDRFSCVSFVAIFAIGLALTLIHLVSIPITNTSVNPARSTGPALFVGGWALAQRHGLAVADLLDACSTDLQERQRFTSRVNAGLAGPRATAAVLTGLPVAGIGLGQMIGAKPLIVLCSGGVGGVLLVVGVVLACAGLLWSDAITGKALR